MVIYEIFLSLLFVIILQVIMVAVVSILYLMKILLYGRFYDQGLKKKNCKLAKTIRQSE